MNTVTEKDVVTPVGFLYIDKTSSTENLPMSLYVNPTSICEAACSQEEGVVLDHLDLARLMHCRGHMVSQVIQRLAKRGVIQLPPKELRDVVNIYGEPDKKELYIFKGEGGRVASIIVVSLMYPEFTADLVRIWDESYSSYEF